MKYVENKSCTEWPVLFAFFVISFVDVKVYLRVT